MTELNHGPRTRRIEADLLYLGKSGVISEEWYSNRPGDGNRRWHITTNGGYSYSLHTNEVEIFIAGAKAGLHVPAPVIQ